MRAIGVAAAAFALVVSACGGTAEPSKSTTPTTTPAPRSTVAEAPVERQPVEVTVRARRLGQSLHLDIEGLARGYGEGEAVEDPQQWLVVARSEGRDLNRMVNGPVRVDRRPVGSAHGSRWDVHVRFSVAFAVGEDAREVDVVVTPPESKPVTLVVRDELVIASDDLD